MLPLSVPPPAFLLDPPAGPPALEKPVKVQVGILHFNDGAAVMVEHARMVGLFVYRTLSGGEDIWDEGDRKSTRLNSSHQIISYAVFSFKKKKTNQRTRTR